jgi:serine protease Do
VVFIAATSINPYRLSERVSHVVGSGFLFEEGGLILTNSHVVYNRQSIRVTLDDGTTLAAQVVGADPILDVAVLRLADPPSGRVPVLPLADSDQIRVGEEVVAIGNPLGLEQTATRGIVSAMNRILPETPLSPAEPLIQTDAAINPGNSGGPLLNRCGEVVGITTAVIPDAQNIGFAIPINVVKAILPSLRERGRVIRPWVGFHGQLVGEGIRDLLKIPLVEGLLVEVIEPRSPAATAGLRGGQLEMTIEGRDFLFGGDVITAMNGTRLTSDQGLTEVMRKLAVGDTLRLTVFRDGDYQDVQYVLPERPILPDDISDRATMAPLTPGARTGPGREVTGGGRRIRGR